MLAPANERSSADGDCEIRKVLQGLKPTFFLGLCGTRPRGCPGHALLQSNGTLAVSSVSLSKLDIHPLLMEQCACLFFDGGKQQSQGFNPWRGQLLCALGTKLSRQHLHGSAQHRKHRRKRGVPAVAADLRQRPQRTDRSHLLQDVRIAEQNRLRRDRFVLGLMRADHLRDGLNLRCAKSPARQQFPRPRNGIGNVVPARQLVRILRPVACPNQFPSV
jgi:hypothetical protein